MDATKLLVKRVKPGAFIQGGAFRLDKRPTPTEVRAFRSAVVLYEDCRREGTQVKLGCIVNDLALPPASRPKATGKMELPSEYQAILRDAGIAESKVALFYESVLRNRARKDEVASLKENGESGIPVAVCASIMGRFYYQLSLDGCTQQIGFYAQEQNHQVEEGEKADTACPLGPSKGAQTHTSGYTLQIQVINFWLYADGKMSNPAVFEPEEKKGGE